MTDSQRSEMSVAAYAIVGLLLMFGCGVVAVILAVVR